MLGTIGTVDRQDLTINQIPKGLQDAVVSAEDRGFWTEGGISPTGILRAAYEDVTGGSGASPQGGSTITQEFVRNYYSYANVGTQQTISRKVKEIFIAQKLASSKSKDWILQNYMNVIYLGDGAYGVEAASETYFGEPVSKLTVAQDAVIAAIIQAPSTYYLPQYRANLKTRWQLRARRHGEDRRPVPGPGGLHDVPEAADRQPLLHRARSVDRLLDHLHRALGVLPHDAGLR